MNPISNTAYYCCGVRKLDANMPDSLCNDHYAGRFMDEHGKKIFEPFRSETLSNLCCAVRCQIIDNMVRAVLHEDVNTSIVSLGCGFDSRPFRLQGGRWYEVDEAPLIDLKNDRMPISECPNPLMRIAINFSEESLIEKLACIGKDQPILVIFEGVAMYLSRSVMSNTLQQLKRLFPKHILITDLMTQKFAELSKGTIYEKLSAIGAKVEPAMENPRRFFLDHDYIEHEYIAHFTHAAKTSALWRWAKISRPFSWLMSNVIYRAVNDYGVHRFELDSCTL